MRTKFRFLLRYSRDVQKMMGAGCGTGVVWWQRHLFQSWSRLLVELFCCLYESVFLKHENLSWRCGKRMDIAFRSQRVYYSTVFKEALFWINPNSYHTCLQNSLWDWVGWLLVGSSGHWVECASSWCWTKPVNITGGSAEGADLSLGPITPLANWAEAAPTFCGSHSTQLSMTSLCITGSFLWLSLHSVHFSHGSF